MRTPRVAETSERDEEATDSTMDGDREGDGVDTNVIGELYGIVRRAVAGRPRISVVCRRPSWDTAHKSNDRSRSPDSDPQRNYSSMYRVQGARGTTGFQGPR